MSDNSWGTIRAADIQPGTISMHGTHIESAIQDGAIEVSIQTPFQGVWMTCVSRLSPAEAKAFAEHLLAQVASMAYPLRLDAAQEARLTAWTAQQKATIKWCMHIIGPDEVHAARSYEKAVAMAEEMNRAMGARYDGSEHEPLAFSMAAPYPWPDHAAALLKQEALEADHERKRAIAAAAAYRPGLPE